MKKFRNFRVSVLLFASLIITAYSTADIIRVSPESGLKYLPASVISSVSGTDDGTLVCWLDESFNGSLFIQKITGSGDLYWNPEGILVNTDLGTGFTEESDFPSVYSDGKGGAVVIYRKVFFDSEEIYCSKISQYGYVQEAVCLSSLYRGYNFSPVSAKTHDDCIVVAWENFYNGNFDIHAQKIDFECLRLWNSGTEVTVCGNGYDQRKPSLICRSDNSIIFTWLDTRNISDSRDAGFDLFGNRIDRNGNYTDFGDSGKLLMNYGERVNSNNLKIIGNKDSMGFMNIQKEYMYNHNSVLSDKNSIILSAEIRTADTDSYIRTIKFNDKLEKIWENNIDEESFQSDPLIISDGNSGACIFWNDGRNCEKNIYGTRFSSNGQSINNDAGGIKISNDPEKSIEKRKLPDSYNKNGITENNNRIYFTYSVSGAGSFYLSEFELQNSANIKKDPQAISVVPGIYKDISVTFPGNKKVIVFLKDNIVYASVNSESKAQEISGSIKAGSYPNPFNPYTKITYELPSSADISLKIYDIAGRFVEGFFNKKQSKGKYEFNFNASGLPGGIYFCKIESGKYSSVLKLMFLK
ncbi:MAG: T9SS type A sorting domain-containing protein [Ignavibacteria bacterium]|nr:T9SS type A sorting domain-containing protein [Ignavibacteria bacterium]